MSLTIAYLEQRGIDRPLIDECINRRLLYESAIWHNCAFVGRDDKGKARFAALRGTSGDFKCDAEGSDKRFGFCLPPNERDCKTVIVFESPIDALSHKSLFPDVDGYRLSLGGTALVALTNFLEYHSDIKIVVAATDNDDAGNLAADKIAELSDYNVTRSLPPVGKDWNETLTLQRNEVNPFVLLSLDCIIYQELIPVENGMRPRLSYIALSSEFKESLFGKPLCEVIVALRAAKQY
ncbi:hypothetical protein FACS1894202_11800 [Clostridia bacterium]|nr:hypothetical protein FACS1894202_11800 [Clostridia bacterium]